MTWVTDRDFLGIIFARILEFVKEYRSFGKTVQRYIDIGTGTGEVLKYFVGHYIEEQNILADAEAVGIDVSDKMLNIASEKVKNYPGIKLIKTSITNHELEYDSFNFAICRNAFHHFNSPEQAFLEMRKLVRKDGGRIFIIEGVAPDNYTLSRWKEVLLNRDVGRNPRILLSMENVEDFFNRNIGIRPDKIVELTSIPMLLSNWLDNAIITADLRRDIAIKTDRLYKDEDFRNKFGLERVKKEPEKDFKFKKRSVLLEFHS